MNKFTKWQRMTYFKQLFDDPSGDGAGGTGDGNKDGSSGGSSDKGENTGQDGGKDQGNGSNQQGADEKKYTDADVDRMINQKFANWQKKQEKAVSEAKKLASMSEQEKAEHERDELQKELDALKKANALAEMGRQARKMLSDDGITAPDELVDMIITDEAETTKANVQQFSKLFKGAVQAAVKEALKGKAPGTGSSGSMTKEQIMNIKDPIARQQKMKENIGLFKNS